MCERLYTQGGVHVCVYALKGEIVRNCVCETGVYLFVLFVTISLWDIKSISSTFPSLCTSLFFNFELHHDCEGTMRFVFLVLHKIAAITVNVNIKIVPIYFLNTHKTTLIVNVSSVHIIPMKTWLVFVIFPQKEMI